MFALHRGVFRKAQLHLVALVRRDHGVGDAGVAAGGVQYYFVVGELAGALPVQDHVERRPILHRTAGIEEFSFAVDLDAGKVACDTFHADQGRVTDERQKFRRDETRGRGGRDGGSDGHRDLIYSITRMSVDNRTFGTSSLMRAEVKKSQALG